MRHRGLLVVTAAAAAAAAPAALAAAAPSLFGVVGPGFDIGLANASGALVTQIDNGTYEIEISDRSPDHNFHLTGPGVNEATSVEGTGTVVWTVTLQNGRYTLLCDPHPSEMRRTFVAGTAPPEPAPTPPPPPPTATRTRLLATVGPGRTITLRNARGGRIASLRPGAYAIVVRDRTKAHNFHLVGPGVNRRTAVARTGTATWNVTLRRGTLRFYSDAAARTLKGSLPVR